MSGKPTPQQYANAARDALQAAADRLNEAKDAGVLIQFAIGQAQDGKMHVTQFGAFSEMKLDN